MRIAITGSTGFVGRTLARFLEERGYEVVRVAGDLRVPGWEDQLRGCDHVYALAANMGGREFIARAGAQILVDNIQIAMSTMRAVREVGARVLFVSSACVYPVDREGQLSEADAIPAFPDATYGWSKLVGEMIFGQYPHSRIVRMDSVYGAGERWRGGREKVIPALCRKVALAKKNNNGPVSVFGDGKQTRCFLHVEDAVRAFERLIWADYAGPVNLGGSDEVDVVSLLGMICRVAGVTVAPRFEPGPTGKQNRRLDLTYLNTLIRWKPEVDLLSGIAAEYSWIEGQL